MNLGACDGGPQGDWRSCCVREDARVIAINRGAFQLLDQSPVPSVTGRNHIDRGLVKEICLGVVEAASDDPRIQSDHRGGAKHNYVFHNLAG